MNLDFEWDPRKARSNVMRHGVAFGEAATAFVDPLSAMVPDLRHSASEERFILFGRSEQGRLLAVMHTERGNTIRIISARLMTPQERRAYAAGGPKNV